MGLLKDAYNPDYMAFLRGIVSDAASTFAVERAEHPEAEAVARLRKGAMQLSLEEAQEYLMAAVTLLAEHQEDTSGWLDD